MISKAGITPIIAAGKSLSATQASGSVALGSVGDFVWVCNLGANDAFVELGPSTVAVVADTGFCVPTDREVLLRRDPATDTYLAGICATGETATLKICPCYVG
jgi:hypothetical protein